MRKEGKNFIQIVKKILRFGDLSLHQRTVQGINIDYKKAIILCEECDASTTVTKDQSGWNLGEWKPYLRKTQVLKSASGYYITSNIEFYCPDCQN